MDSGAIVAGDGATLRVGEELPLNALCSHCHPALNTAHDEFIRPPHPVNHESINNLFFLFLLVTKGCLQKKMWSDPGTFNMERLN